MTATNGAMNRLAVLSLRFPAAAVALSHAGSRMSQTKMTVGNRQEENAFGATRTPRPSQTAWHKKPAGATGAGPVINRAQNLGVTSTKSRPAAFKKASRPRDIRTRTPVGCLPNAWSFGSASQGAP
jgi:hypothetical protein